MEQWAHILLLPLSTLRGIVLYVFYYNAIEKSIYSKTLRNLFFL